MDGVINVYKPIGPTSFDVVRKIRKIAHTKKVGHTGTLDPEASGVLPVCIGKATKLVDLIMNNEKAYIAEVKLGIVTNTYDREGKIVSEKEVNSTEEQVISVIKSFIGEINQIPPMFSAIKVNGKKLYELARQGIEIERAERKIYIYDIEIINISLPSVIIKVKCSKGTYIRSLCFDIGNSLGCGATMWNLERIASGLFNKENSVHLDDIEEYNLQEFVIPLEQCVSNFERISFDKMYGKMLMNGVRLHDFRLINCLKEDILYRVYVEDEFIGIGEKQRKEFKIIKLLL